MTEAGSGLYQGQVCEATENWEFLKLMKTGSLLS